uniref:ARID domain-containing protein n=1 Tax=Panagrellus redivivus TaxID=6233 RepID=A0A7E4V9C4_PANRE
MASERLFQQWRVVCVVSGQARECEIKRVDDERWLPSPDGSTTSRPPLARRLSMRQGREGCCLPSRPRVSVVSIFETESRRARAVGRPHTSQFPLRSEAKMSQGVRKKAVDPEMEAYFQTLETSHEDIVKEKQFDEQLRSFYRSKWNCNVKLPALNGAPVNLYKLYTAVLSHGGWVKVCTQDKWPLVAEALDLDALKISMLDNGLKLIYCRYLAKFEEVQTVGDFDDHDVDLYGGKVRAKVMASNDCPISLAYREKRNEASNDPDYSRIIKSLVSGLPNEVDFAMNALKLMSAPGPILLNLENCPMLISLLIAHAGVYGSDQHLRDIAEDGWKKFIDRNFDQFWANAGIEDADIRAMVPVEGTSELDSYESQIFSLDSDYDPLHETTFRVHEVVGILRNLSFESANTHILGKSDTLVRFICIVAASKFLRLGNDVLDILTNIASDLDLVTAEGVYEHVMLLKVLSDCLYSDDKNRVLHSLESLAQLCQNERNEAACVEFVDSAILGRVFELATVRDVMICIHTLETLYQFSELGRAACQKIVAHPGAIDQLINLVTTDAASFGRTGLSGIKVVESFGNNQQVRQHYPPPAPPQHQQYRGPPVYGTPTSQPMQVQISRQPVQRIVIPQAPSPNITMDDRLKTLTVKWIKENVVADPEGTAIRGEMYCAYVDHMKNVHNIMSGSAIMFTNVVQSIFPKTTIKGEQRDSSVLYLFTGIRYINQVPTGTAPTPAAVAASNVATSHPIMQKILHPSQPVVTKVSPVTVVTNGAPKPDSPEAEASATSPNGSVQSDGTVVTNGSAEAANNAKLEICSAAIEARALLPEGDQHETLIIRVENTTKAEKEKAAKCNGSHPAPVVNGHVNGTKKTPVIEAVETPSGIEEVVDTDKVIEAIKLNGKLTNGVSHAENDEKLDDTIESVICQSAKEPETKNGIWKSTRVRRATHKHDEDPSPTLNGTTTTPTKNNKRKRPSASKTPAKRARRSDSSKAGATTSEAEIPVAVEEPLPSTSQPIGDFLCEWNACGQLFNSVDAILGHHMVEHCGFEGNPETATYFCMWPTCDGTKRAKWSLITHIMDHHCSESHLKHSAAKRLSEPGGLGGYLARIKQQLLERPKEMSQAQAFAPAAATDAIRRHAFGNLQREVFDEQEGPVTKCIRLTTALILRNIARYSEEGRSKLRRYEMQLCPFALSRLEASGALAQCLSELYQLKPAQTVHEYTIEKMRQNRPQLRPQQPQGIPGSSARPSGHQVAAMHYIRH